MIVAANQEHKPDPVVPLGAAMVAAAARNAGHDVCLFDACFRGERVASDLRQALRAFQPRVVGLSIRNIDDVCWPAAQSYLPYYKQLAAAIRESAPDACLVLGGSAFTLMPSAFINALGADHGIAGEGEQAFVNLLSRVDVDGTGSISWAHPVLVPDVAPALDLLDVDEYYARGGALNLQTRRGCAFKCTYCTYPVLEGRQPRPRTIETVVDGLQYSLDRHGVRHFFVVDNTFNHPPDHAFAFCNELRKRRLDVSWTAYVSPARLAPGLLQQMADAGCSSVEFGTDAASEVTLRALGKSFTQIDVIDASRKATAAGLKFAHSLILGGPDETAESWRETVDVIESTNPSAVFVMLGVRLYPGTSLARRAEQEGLIRESEIGLDPVFYLGAEVADGLEQRARELSASHPNWYFPGLEGNRWLRYWRRRRSHGVRGPLWEQMATPGPAAAQEVPQ